jgi:aconitase A
MVNDLPGSFQSGAYDQRPFTPDLATPLSKFASFVKENGWSDELSAGLIGSCTNSSYEDMVIWTFPTHRSAIDS